MWSEKLENPKAVEMYESEPSLDNVILAKLSLDRNGPTVTMTIHLREYPTNPPAKWRRGEHNAVTMEIQAMGVDYVSLNGWDMANHVSVSLERREDAKLEVRIRGEGISVELRCGWLRMVGMTPYRLLI